MKDGIKLAVIGSRGFNDFELLKKELDKYNIRKIISGGANGADKLAEMYAKKNDIKMKIYYPDWDKHGRAAGPIRNGLIIKDCDEAIAFWDGKSAGTKSSIFIAEETGKKINIIRYNKD